VHKLINMHSQIIDELINQYRLFWIFYGVATRGSLPIFNHYKLSNVSSLSSSLSSLNYWFDIDSNESRYYLSLFLIFETNIGRINHLFHCVLTHSLSPNPLPCSQPSPTTPIPSNATLNDATMYDFTKHPNQPQNQYQKLLHHITSHAASNTTTSIPWTPRPTVHSAQNITNRAPQ